MDHKSLSIEAMDEAGTGLARIATLSAIDQGGDTYASGAFGWKEGGAQWAQILPCHDWRAMPLGKARVYEQGDTVFAELKLNLDHQAGRDWHAALKFDLAQGTAIQEWSYGYNVLDADYQQRGDVRVRVLKRLDVMEVSPVLRGAGMGTGTLALKNAALKDDRFAALLGELGTLAETIKAGPGALSASGIKQLGQIHEALGAALTGLATADIDVKQAGNDQLLARSLQGLARAHLPSACGHKSGFASSGPKSAVRPSA